MKTVKERDIWTTDEIEEGPDKGKSHWKKVGVYQEDEYGNGRIILLESIGEHKSLIIKNQPHDQRREFLSAE